MMMMEISGDESDENNNDDDNGDNDIDNDSIDNDNEFIFDVHNAKKGRC